jgi:hypothetical protein
MINTSDFSQEAGTVIFMVVPVISHKKQELLFLWWCPWFLTRSRNCYFYGGARDFSQEAGTVMFMVVPVLLIRF